jgi:hypothetical protein
MVGHPWKKAKKIRHHLKEAPPTPLEKNQFPTWDDHAIPYHNPTTTII